MWKFHQIVGHGWFRERYEPVQPLASSPRPWRKITVTGVVEDGDGAGMITGRALVMAVGCTEDMGWKAVEGTSLGPAAVVVPFYNVTPPTIISHR